MKWSLKGEKNPVTNQLIITVEAILAIFLCTREREVQEEVKTSCKVARKRKTSGTRVNVANQCPQNGLRLLRKSILGSKTLVDLVCVVYS